MAMPRTDGSGSCNTVTGGDSQHALLQTPPRTSSASGDIMSSTDIMNADVNVVDVDRVREFDLSAGKSLLADDLELARVLQQQELVFYNMAGFGQSAHHGSQHGQEDDDLVSDEELARRLQQAEDEAYADEDFADAPDLDSLQYEDLQALGDAVGTVSKGLAPEALQQLPSQEFKDLGQALCTDRCCICQEDYQGSDHVTVLPSCMHAYHKHCIIEWLSRNKTCPYCNKEVPRGPQQTDG